jgi:hypothetical protein
VPGYDPALFCGNAAWLPGFPLLMRALGSWGVAHDTAGAWIAGVCAVLTLLLIWNAFLDAELSLAAGLTLLLAAFFPGHVYQHAVFPVSLCTLFNVLALHAYKNKRFLWAGIAGFGSAFSYSSGVFLAAVFGLHLLFVDFRRPLQQQMRQWLLTAGITALGLVAFFVLLQVETGTWRAYFMVQGKYSYTPTFPWLAIAKHVGKMRLSGPHFMSVQTVFVAGLGTSLLWAALRPTRRAVDGTLAIFLLIYWWIPLALGGSLSLYRAESMLLPAVTLARKLPIPVLVLLV